MEEFMTHKLGLSGLYDTRILDIQEDRRLKVDQTNDFHTYDTNKNQKRFSKENLTSQALVAKIRNRREKRKSKNRGGGEGKGRAGERDLANSDWECDKDSERSTCGYCFFVGECLISRQSKKQPTAGISSSEATQKHIKVIYVPTSENVANIFTKALSRERPHRLYCKLLNLTTFRRGDC
ncbi:hypothetical protein KP509_13G020700 [Ceratopteris richardii]|uniref:Uncharacterized protein n=1 Tax=Ceratopteris richardii TaxID=49495 RepID=A0A8T2TFZ9_CERRI|nr:hypothetical protein KP509_13G020700 [Ceratopteris richardii]